VTPWARTARGWRWAAADVDDVHLGLGVVKALIPGVWVAGDNVPCVEETRDVAQYEETDVYKGVSGTDTALYPD
jgi:hypothetical protein